MEAAANLPSPLPRELAEPTRLPLGSLLLRDGFLTVQQFEQALTAKDATGHRLGEIVVGQGWVAAATIAVLLAEQHGLEYVDLAKTEVELDVAGLLPEKYARRYEALPLRFVADDVVLVAVADPTNVVASDDLRLALGLNVRLAVAAGPDLTTAIDRSYRTALAVGSPRRSSMKTLPRSRTSAAAPPRARRRSTSSTRSSRVRSTSRRPTSISSRRRSRSSCAPASTASCAG